MVYENEVDTLSKDGRTLRYSDRAMSTTWRSFFLELDEELDQFAMTADKADQLRAEGMAGSPSDK